MARATAVKSTMPVAGECSAATPVAWGSISRELVGADAAQARDAVLDAPALELVEPGELGLVERDDELAAALVRDPVLVAVRRTASRAPSVQSCAFSDPGA